MTAPNHTTGERTAPNWDQQMRLEPATHSTVQVSTCSLYLNLTLLINKQTEWFLFDLETKRSKLNTNRFSGV